MKFAVALWAWAVPSLSLAAPVYSVTAGMDVAPQQPGQVQLKVTPQTGGGLHKPKTTPYATWTGKQWKPLVGQSIIEEEIMSTSQDFGAESTIVDWETKAARDSWVWVPCVTRNQTIRYRRVHMYADNLVVGLVLGFIAVCLMIELCGPVARR